MQYEMRNFIKFSKKVKSKSPQVVPPKKGGKAKRNRKENNINAIRDAKLY